MQTPVRIVFVLATLALVSGCDPTPAQDVARTTRAPVPSASSTGESAPPSNVPPPSTDPTEEATETLPEASFAEVRGWITFQRGSELLAVDPSRPERLVSLRGKVPGYALDWSASGASLLIADDEHLVVLTATREVRTLWVFPDEGVGGGSFSPDGAHVVYSWRGELFVRRSIGGIVYYPRRIVPTAKPNPCEEPVDCDGSADPAWSPDGSRLAFIDKTIVRGVFDGLPKWNVYRTTISEVTPRGTGRRVLIDLGRSDRHRVASWTTGLGWSPDGSRLAFASEGGIYVVDADGSDLQRLTIHGSSPSWSPDGSRIAFRWGRRLRIVDVADGRVHEIGRRLLGRDDSTSVMWIPAP